MLKLAIKAQLFFDAYNVLGKKIPLAAYLPEKKEFRSTENIRDVYQNFKKGILQDPCLLSPIFIGTLPYLGKGEIFYFNLGVLNLNKKCFEPYVVEQIVEGELNDLSRDSLVKIILRDKFQLKIFNEGCLRLIDFLEIMEEDITKEFFPNFQKENV